ncbi:hypothetical protein, partial [Anaerofustis stercorihominis]|uniref:hypothetical protein n=1 Tax=Anaerofustis stercorihominis TaxID=214853 RepID=UPI00214AAD76
KKWRVVGWNPARGVRGRAPRRFVSFQRNILSTGYPLKFRKYVLKRLKLPKNIKKNPFLVA